MKHILTIVFIGLVFGGYGQNRYHEDKVVCPNDSITYLKIDMELLNGNVYCEFGDMGKYINGKPDGLHKDWHENGQLKKKGNYNENHRRHGIVITYNDKGVVTNELIYFNGYSKEALNDVLYHLEMYNLFKGSAMELKARLKNDNQLLMKAHEKARNNEYEGSIKDFKILLGIE